MNENQKKTNASTKAYTYLTLTLVLVFILALTWSIDSSIVYILGGTIIYTAFLTVYRWPRKTRPEDWRNYQHEDRNTGKTPGTPPAQQTNTTQTQTIASDFKSLFETFTKKASATGKPPTGSTASNPQLHVKTGCIILFISFIVLALALNLIFNDDDPEVDEMSFENQYAQAENYYNTGDYVQAIIHYKYALAKEPANTNATLGLGNSFAGLNNIDSALYYYQHSLTLDPTFDVARYNIGWVHYKTKDYDAATRELKSLIDRNPEYLDAFQMLGDVYYEQQLYDEAFNQYERAYAGGNRNFWLSYVTGYLYQTKGNNQMAIERYKEALTYDSSEVDIYKRLGEIVPGEEGARYRAKGKQW